MSKRIMGRFNGTGAAVYLGLGFVPDYFRLISAEDADFGSVEWFRTPGCAEIARGIHTVGTTAAPDGRTVADTGIHAYTGGELLTATLQTSTGYGEGVYLVRDTKDYKLISTDSINAGDGSGANLTLWTLDTLANKTGHFDGDVVGTYIGEGSRVTIGSLNKFSQVADYDAMITALTAGQGISADEVTLDRAVPSGSIKRITGKYGMVPAAIGSTSLAGVLIEMTSICNVNDEMQLFVAEQYDNIDE